LVKAILKALLPLAVLLMGAAPVLWNGWEAYDHIMCYEGDRSARVN